MPRPEAGTLRFTGEILVKMTGAVGSVGAATQLLGSPAPRPAGAVPALHRQATISDPASDLARWHRVPISRSRQLLSEPGQPKIWEAVREALRQPGVEYAEPEAEVLQYVPPKFSLDTGLELARDWHLGGPPGVGARAAWERIARTTNRKPGEGVTIAHLDTGYSDHPAVPKGRFVSQGVDFWDVTRPNASDPLQEGILLMPGHGTGTICVLAADHPDYQGIATGSRVLPVRVSPSVVQIRTSSLANGIVWACHNGAQVITISMGGLPSQLWADAVNYAYEQGVVICAAAGNNFVLPLGARTPSRVVFPAKFNRVVGVAGVTYRGLRYWSERAGEMCGNFGSQVDISAPTPDVLWAQPPKGYGPGAGTSTATPQVAAAAALWLSFYRDVLASFSPTERVEACTHALLSSARRVGQTPYGRGGKRDLPMFNEYFGAGQLDIDAALEVAPVRGLPSRPRDDVRNVLAEFFGMLSSDQERLGQQIEQAWTVHAG